MLCLYPVGGWAGTQMEGWAFLPLQKAALQRNSTAVSESVWSCLLALSLLFPPAVLCKGSRGVLGTDAAL